MRRLERFRAVIFAAALLVGAGAAITWAQGE